MRHSLRQGLALTSPLDSFSLLCGIRGKKLTLVYFDNGDNALGAVPHGERLMRHGKNSDEAWHRIRVHSADMCSCVFIRAHKCWLRDFFR